MAIVSLIPDKLSDGELVFAKVELPTMSHQIGLFDKSFSDIALDKNLSDRALLKNYPERAPLPEKFGVKQKKHLDGNYIFVHLHGRFFHDFLDSFSYLLALKESNEQFTAVFVSKEKDIINSVGFPRGMFLGEAEKTAEHTTVYIQAFTYLMSMLEHLGVPYLFISASDLQDMSCDYAYIPYIKTDDIYESNDAIDYINYKYNKKIIKYNQPDELNLPDSDYHLVGPVSLRLASFAFEVQIKILRAVWTPESITGGKIYISRRNFADRSNPEESALEEYLSSIGYTVVHLEKYPVWKQVEIVTTASEVVMFSGGSQALSYLCRPETSILWLRPDEYPLKAEKDLHKYFEQIKLNIETIEFNPAVDSIVSLVKNRFNG